MVSPSRWTLRTKLVASIVALFIALTVAIGAATVWTTRNSLMKQVDDQLKDVSQSLSPHDDGAPAGARARRPPQSSNMLRVTFSSLSSANALVVTENSVSLTFGTRTTVPKNDLSELYALPMGPRPATVDLGGDLGRYRLIAIQRATGDTTVVGIPLTLVDNDIKELTQRVIELALVGLLVVGLVSFIIVRRSLLPLRRVAATAQHVSQLPLSKGEAQTDERVPALYTDSRTEVGTVGLALNNLLDHVDHALYARHQSEMQVRQFVADASHELRTPLASIRGYAELSRREPEEVPASVTHALGRIESEAERMTTLVEDLLLLARLDAGRDIERQPVDLTRIVVETLSDLHAAGPDHVWHLDLPEDLEDFPEVIGDEARLRQVVINLLANARRHTPAGTVVTAGLARAGNDVQITVTDNGPGIPPEFMPHLFERFTRGDAARTRTEGSTGLGLSIVDAVVAAHHGHVRVDSEPGFTRFTVTLPIANATGASHVE